MAFDTNNPLAFFNKKAGYGVYEKAFEYQFINEKRKRAKALRNGIMKDDLEPFSPGLVNAAVDPNMMEMVRLSDNQKIELSKWTGSTVTNSYGGDDPERTRRFLSNLIDDIYSSTTWWYNIKERYMSKKEKEKNSVPSSSGTPESLLMDFVWYYSNVRLLEDVKVQASIETYNKQGFPVTLEREYPDEFVARISSKTLKEIYGATDSELSTFSESPFSTPQERCAAIERLFLPLCERSYVDVSENVDDEGHVIEKPVFRMDGSADFVAAMRHLRYIKYQNKRSYMSAKTSGAAIESDTGGYVSYGEKFLSDDFTNLVLNSPYGKNFLLAVGVDITRPYKLDENGNVKKTIEATLFTDEKYNIRNVWLQNKDKRKLNEEGERLENQNTATVKRILMSCIAGRKANLEQGKPAIPAVCSSGKISFEFAARADEADRFIAEFKRQNQNRMDAKKQTGQTIPFSDDFMARCRDRNWLETLGMPEANINKLLAFRMDMNALNDYTRNSFSNMLGGNMGIRSTKAYTGERTEKPLTLQSDAKDILRRLRRESGECYKLSQRQSAVDNYTYIFSDELLEILFRTDILEEVRQRTGIGADASYSQKTSLAWQWINALPEDSPLIDKERAGNPLLPGCISKQTLLTGLGKKNEEASGPADYAAKIFSMLVHSDYRKGDPSYWTERLRLGQRSTFAQALNIDILNLFSACTKPLVPTMPTVNVQNALTAGYNYEEPYQEQETYTYYR
jgi:hypothetical protein